MNLIQSLLLLFQPSASGRALAGELDRERLLPLRFARGDTWTDW
jgi:hypothetical protein